MNQNNLVFKIVLFQNLLSKVTISADFQLKISVCSELQVEGLRGDIVSTRAAKALAAFETREEVTLDDIRRTITLCLRHRLRRDPMESISSGDKVETVFDQIFAGTEI
jgi:magnesium chelatase subunit I